MPVINYVIFFSAAILITLFSLGYKKLTPPGVYCAWIVGFACMYFGGLFGFVTLLVTFIFLIVSDRLAQKEKARLNDINEKSDRRDIFQVLSNVGIGTLVLIIFGFTNEPRFLICFSACMAGSLADSFASAFGSLSRLPAIDILSFNKVRNGLSGGITANGLTASLFGSLIISLVYGIFINFNILTMLFIITVGFLAAIVDSILGSLIQSKYKCAVCGLLTEKHEHCKKKTVWVKGLKFINNDAVNFLSGTIAFLISLIIFVF